MLEGQGLGADPRYRATASWQTIYSLDNNPESGGSVVYWLP